VPTSLRSGFRRWLPCGALHGGQFPLANTKRECVRPDGAFDLRGVPRLGGLDGKSRCWTLAGWGELRCRPRERRCQYRRVGVLARSCGSLCNWAVLQAAGLGSAHPQGRGGGGETSWAFKVLRWAQGHTRMRWCVDAHQCGRRAPDEAVGKLVRRFPAPLAVGGIVGSCVATVLTYEAGASREQPPCTHCRDVTDQLASWTPGLFWCSASQIPTDVRGTQPCCRRRHRIHRHPRLPS